MSRLRIRGGRIIDPARDIDAIGDLLIEDGRIVEHLEGPVDTTIDAKGLVVCPGLIDMHVHLREPGEEWKEDIESGSRAAVAGGVTTMCCMPNTKPVLDHAGAIRFVRQRAKEVGLCDVHPIAAITRGLKGEHLTEMRDLHRAGAVAFSDDGLPVWHGGVMRKALEYAASFSYLIIQHAEDPHLAQNGSINEGWISTLLGIAGIPNCAEDAMVARDIMLAELVGARYHVAHISSAGAVDLVRKARAKGLAVSAEAAPHHFALTEDAVLGYRTNAKMNPPLRREEDRLAVIEGLRDGTISVIATDHAPHHEDDKRCGLECAAFGIVGLETLLPVSLSLVRDGVLTLPELIAKMTINPAKLLGLPCGTLAPGADADVCIFDPDLPWVMERERLFSKSHNTPWLGQTLIGKVIMTLHKGVIVYREGEILA